MSDTVEQIKSRLDIVDVVSGYLKLQKAGANYKTRCPFHNEKSPSFHISPERQSWHCFGCNKGGDMFSFVQEIDGIEFVEALRLLAAKAGVQLPVYNPAQSVARDARGPLLAVAELSAKFFAKQLWNGTAGAKALAYLHERGLTDETIQAWRLGWAPNDWQALTTFLVEQGHSSRDITGAGMAIDKNGRPYDRFRSRIMFPICDANGQVVGFTGRVFGAQVAVNGEAPAKYVNTPQTAIYDKSSVVFGLDKAKLDMRRRDECLLVEGNMDAIMSWQAGATNVAATSGTALTPQQLKMLARYSTNLSFCFDTDAAGQTATRRGIGLALAQNFSIKVLTITDQECKDPADYVAKYGDKFNEVVASAKPVLQYYYDTAVASYDPSSAQSKKSVVASMGPLINRLTSKVEQGHWIAQLSSLLRANARDVQADVAAVRDDIATYERNDDTVASQVGVSVPMAPIDAHSQEFLGIVAVHPELLEHARSRDLTLLDPRVAAIIEHPELLQSGVEHEYKHEVDAAFLRAQEVWQGWGGEELKAELVRIEGRLHVRRLRERNIRLALDIQRAENDKNIAERDRLLREFQETNQQINQLQNGTSI